MSKQENERLERHEIAGKGRTQLVHLRDNEEKSDYFADFPGSLVGR